MNKNYFRDFLIAALFSVAAFVVPSAADAQLVLRKQNTLSRSQVSNIIRDAEQASDKFRTDFRNQMDRNNNLSNSQKSQYNGYVANCEDSIDRLRSQFDNDNNWWQSRNQVQSVINSSQDVNTMMNVLPFRRNLESQWNSLRSRLNVLADTYDLPGLNGGGWNGGGGNGGGWGGGNGGGWGGGQTDTPPSWAQGTWYWTNGPDRRMTIERNGRITLFTAGQSSNGRYYQNRIYLDGNSSTLTRSGNNIRTYNQSTGETSDYSKNPWNGGDGGWNGGGGGGATTPPSWAQGTWYWMNGPDRRMTIDRNGRVTLFTAGQTTYGTYRNGNVVLDGNISPLSRNGNNIRTYNQSTGETSDYSKSPWNGGGGDGGGNAGSPPNWARGTFVWTGGPDRTMSIDSNGRVTLYTAGRTSYGTYNNGTIMLDGNLSTVTRSNNGIRTYNQSTGETSNYRKQ